MMEKQNWHISLSEKLYYMVSWIILALSLVLTLTSFRQHCKKVDSYNFDETRRVAEGAAVSLPEEYIENLWNRINTEEFRHIRSTAISAGDEKIISDWMRRQPSAIADYLDDLGKNYPTISAKYDPDSFSLYDDYRELISVCKDYMKLFEVKDVYVQYMEGDVTYNLVDPNESLLYIGSSETPEAEFASYSDNEAVPPTTYSSPRWGWLCTACQPVYSQNTGRAVGLACVDLDMNGVMREREEYIAHILFFILLELLVIVLISMLLIRHMVTKPLTMLTDAAKGFASSGEGYKKEDVISLPIKSSDEIGDLYREIRSMQERIVDYTENITRITAERERVDTELRMASQIQNAMLPSHFPAFPDRDEFDLYASMDPAKEVGGDFYDFFMTDDNHLCLLIADVSDKGVPAALFMMAAKILINYRAMQGGTPEDILAAVNEILCRNNKSKMFVTVWMGILELDSGRLRCANAGHVYPMIRGRDGIFRVFKDTHNLVVGAIPMVPYQGYELTLETGDAVFVYTDGVPEAINADREFYGMERLTEVLNAEPTAIPEKLLENVRKDLDRFTGNAKQFDDITMLCIEYKKCYDHNNHT